MGELKRLCDACGREFPYRPGKRFCSSKCRQYHFRVGNQESVNWKPLNENLRLAANYMEYSEFVSDYPLESILEMPAYFFIRLYYNIDYQACDFSEFLKVFVRDFLPDMNSQNSIMAKRYWQFRQLFEAGQVSFTNVVSGIQLFKNGNYTEKLHPADVFETFCDEYGTETN